MTASQQPTGHDKAVERACGVMHDAYERAALGAGWETNPASRKPWADVPEANKATMRAAVAALYAHLRAALAAGDADVAEALGLKGQWSATDLTSVELDQKPTIDGWPTREQAEALFVHDGDDVLLRRFVTDWTEVPGE